MSLASKVCRGPGRGRYRPSRGGALHDQLSQAVHRTDPNPDAAHWSDSSLRCSPRPDGSRKLDQHTAAPAC